MQKSTMMAVAGGGLLIALLIGGILVTSGGGATATKSDPSRTMFAAEPASVPAAEANAWAEARAADTPEAYRTYLAAFPEGAFNAEANQAIGRVEAEAKVKETAAPPARSTRVVEHASSGPSPATIRSRCHAYVNQQLPPPSKTTRAATGAAAGCAVGAMAGGNDGRNCAIGAIVGGGTGYVTAGNRERKRDEMYQTCVARGGPGG